VTTVVIVESVEGHPDAMPTSTVFSKTCRIEEAVPQPLARRGAEVGRRARRGSAVDALVVATAEPGGTILTGDVQDLEALAAEADNVAVVVA